MARIRLVQFACIVVYGLVATANAFGQTRSYVRPLQDAIERGQVTAQFESNGSSTGDSITVTVSKTAKAPAGTLLLSVPAGLYLYNASGTGQSMAISGLRGRVVSPTIYYSDGRIAIPAKFTPANTIVLLSRKPVSYVLSAYCAEFHKNNPAASSTFVIQSADPMLACTLRESKRRGLSIRSTQAAVWIQTDHASYDAVRQKFVLDSREWSGGWQAARTCNPNASVWTSPPSAWSPAATVINSGISPAIVTPAPIVPSGPSFEKTQLKAWLDNELPQINLEKQSLDAEKSELEKDKAIQQMANGTVGFAPSKARPWLEASDAINTAQLNTRISSWNNRAQQLQQRINHYNGEVQRYNSMQ